MLSAILNGKGRRLPISLPAGASLRTAFVKSEDILTSTVFERLAYLDGATLWAVLAATFRPRILPDRKVADLERIEFWPTWGQAKGTLERSVEPDVVMRFSIGDPPLDVVLIVECKLGGMQYPDQWYREWIAFRAEGAADEEVAETCLLALGGLPADAETVVRDFGTKLRETHGVEVKAAAADWRDLLRALDEVEIARPSDRRVVTDIKAALALHGYGHFTPMAGLAAIATTYGISPGAADLLGPLAEPGETVVRPAVKPDAPVASHEDPLLGWTDRVARYRPVSDHPILYRRTQHAG